MRKTFTIRNTQELACPEIGTLQLDSTVGLLAFVELAKNCYLNIVPAMSKEKAEAIRADQEENEAEQDRIQAEIDAEASALPDEGYKLEELRPKQLKALCEAKGLKTYGTGADLLARLQEHAASEEGEAGEGFDGDLEDLTVPELRALAKKYDLDTKGNRDALIERIAAFAAAQEAVDSGQLTEDSGEGTDTTDTTDTTDGTDGASVTEDAGGPPALHDGDASEDSQIGMSETLEGASD